MPLIATKTIIGLTAAATAIGSMVGGDIEQKYAIASEYVESHVELVVEGMVQEEMSKIDTQRLGTGGNF